MRKKTQTCTVELLSSGQSWGRGMWRCLGPDRDRFISVLSDNATIIQASRLQHSSIVFSFALCLVALVHVEFELYAHQRMLQFLSHQREGNIYPLGKQTDCFRAESWEFRKLNDLWVLVFEWRPFIKESNILTKCTVESITGRFFYLVPGRELKR